MIQASWLASKSGPEKEEFKQFLLSNKKVLDILVEMLYNRLREVESISRSDYTDTSWAFEQAHRNGQRDELKSLITLCTVTI